MSSKVLNSKQLALKIVKFANDKKALDVVVLEMRSLVNFCDYFVIATGTSDRQARAIIDGVEDGLTKDGVHVKVNRAIKGFGAHDTAAEAGGAWMLLDMGDVVLHVFEPNSREFYGLEHLWQDAPQLDITKKSRKK